MTPEPIEKDFTHVLTGSQELREKSVEAIDKSRELMREISDTLKKAEAFVAND